MVASVYNVVHVKPLPYEPIFALAAIACTGAALGMQSAVSLCFAIVLAVILLVLDAIRPSQARVAIATCLIMSFTADPRRWMVPDLRPQCSDLHDTLHDELSSRASPEPGFFTPEFSGMVLFSCINSSKDIL